MDAVSALKHKGMSLLEVLLVLSIIGIFSTLGWLSLRTFQTRLEVQQAQQTLVSTLNRARSNARRFSRDEAVNWTETTLTVGTGSAAKTVDLSEAGTVTLEVTKGSATGPIVYQGPYARVGGADREFTLTGRGGRTARVRVFGVTGKAAVSED